MRTRTYRGFKMGMYDNPKFPRYPIYNEEGKCIEYTIFPSEFKDIVDRLIFKRSLSDYLANTSDKHILFVVRDAFAQAMMRQGSRYREDHDGDVEKIWNEGRGRLSFIRIYPLSEEILVNDCLSNHWDQKHLDDVMDMLEIKDWKVLHAKYGYPDYYNHDFGKKYINN